MATVFVLLVTDMGAETEVMTELKTIVEIKEAHKIYGQYAQFCNH